MKCFRIHFTVAGVEDSIVLEAETIEQLREMAADELKKRGGTNPWSEDLSDKEENIRGVIS